MANLSPILGPTTKRESRMVSARDWRFAHAETEKWFGPYNPTHLPDWVSRRMRSDWSIGFAREIWLSAFHGVHYHVAGGDPRVRAFVEAAVLEHIWQWIEAQLRALDYGRQSCELVWQQRDVAISFAEANTPGEGEPREEVLRGAYVLGEMRDLDPEMTEVLADEVTGDYRGLRYSGVDIPARRTLHVVNEPEFGSLLGTSQNVRAYNPWWWCNLVYMGLNRYLERKGDPPLIGFAPGESTTDTQGNEQDPVKITAIGLANLRSSSSYVFPQEFDAESKQPLYSVRSLEVANRAPEFLQTIDRYEQNKRLAWLIPGSLGEGGSFASDKVAQQTVHRMFDRRLQRLILDPLNKHVIPKLVRFNFGDVPASSYPRLAAGSMAENAKELLSEIVRSALTLETILPDGRRARIAETIDMTRALRTLNIPTVAPELIPTAPDAPADAGFPTPGRPPSMVPESNRPNVPGRPGQFASKGGGPSADAWFADVDAALGTIDATVAKAERVAESHRVAAQEQVRAVLRKRIAAAKTTSTADGAEVISTRNRTLADQVEREVTSKLEDIIDGDLLDESDFRGAGIPLARPVPFARSPMVDAHIAAARAAADLLKKMDIPTPGAAQAKRIVGDIVRDGRRNGRGVVIREARRVTEEMDRIVQSGFTPEAADAVIDAYELPRKEFVESTVHHVRATARATLAWSGALAGADQEWLIAAGPSVVESLAERAPSGEIAGLLYQIKTTAELDKLFADKSTTAPVTHWRNLGANFFSEEMYVPLPADEALAQSVRDLARKRRAAFMRLAAARQAEIDAAQPKGSTQP